MHEALAFVRCLARVGYTPEWMGVNGGACHQSQLRADPFGGLSQVPLPTPTYYQWAHCVSHVLDKGEYTIATMIGAMRSASFPITSLLASVASWQ
jgi:hypothetical protein